jgi:hypothetical protein
MNDTLIEELLNEDESSSLDFKRVQYPFEKATDEEKSKLIKDIIAFANAWRRSDAYILIGVDEVKGGRSIVFGVQYHLNESNLQQLVNSKTQHPVSFSYHAYEFEGHQIGIITIPPQERPIYLKKNFGILKKEVVYIRRGSSTDEAKPDEIARMGIAAVQGGKKVPVLNLYFGDNSTRKEIGSKITVNSLVLWPLLPVDIIKPKPKVHPLGIDLGFIDPLLNKNYYKELIEYVFLRNLLSSIYFIIENKSGEVASGVKLKTIINYQEGVYLSDESKGPQRPHKEVLSNISSMPSLKNYLLNQPHTSVDAFSDHWELNISFGDVLPGSNMWTNAPIYIGGNITQNVDFDVNIYAQNLPEPIRIALSVQVLTEKRPMELTDIEEYLDKDK